MSIRANWQALLVAFAGGVMLAGVRSGFAVIYPQMVEQTTWTRVDVIAAFSTAMLLYSVGSLAIGVLIDRFGVRGPLLGGTLLMTIAAASSSLSTEPLHLTLTLGVIGGIGMSATGFVPILKMLVEQLPGRLSLGLVTMQLGQGAGILVVTPGMAWLLSVVDWRSAMLLSAGLLLIAVPVFLTLPNPSVSTQKPPVPDSGAWANSPMRAYAAPFVFLVASSFALGFTNLVNTHQVAALLDAGFPSAGAASIAAQTGLFAFGGALAVAATWSKLDPRASFAASGLLFCAGCIALAALSPGLLPIAALYVIGVGAGKGALSVVLSLVQGQLLPLKTFGRVMGLQEIAIGMGAFAGPWIAALWRDEVGTFLPGLVAAGAAGLLVTAGLTLATMGTALGRPRAS